ncbi:aldose epimerase family protein [Neobacillus massiliamazoniensis]|uniref:Aldose 1-epimerase n=1 Tax=Neobacillus massiliamazoniensis TaxID=1499688 RepID=A0A0U1NTL3_9BACI|nr:aldose epimerase family protein [Neobacillus massiliamazoniensis]CRK81305.1 aldose 1-epimerase [Neobacillus massiliamazoniensis]
MRITHEPFGEWDGQLVTAYTMVNDHGMSVTSLDYGCIITSVLTPDKNGKIENIVLGFDTIEEYREHSPYFGAVVGRVAGRIKNAEFELDQKTYQLAANDNSNHLHGGVQGFDKVIWKTEMVKHEDWVRLEFTYLSKDGEEGYPGNLQTKVTYTLTNENELQIAYRGESDKRTLLNVTNHSYFNLSGNVKRDILGHQLTLKSSSFVELGDDLIPTGQILPVENTPFDFQSGRKIKDGATSEHSQNILVGNGYDHPFLLTENNRNEIILVDDESGRMLTVETVQPAVVLYTANQLGDHFSMRGVQSRNYLGLCLETQGVPDSIHHPHFPPSILEKGELYQSTTKYKFSVV